MRDPLEKKALAEAYNGVKTPLYFDRQVVRASDLNLDRRSHDEELQRMRRLLHGWGIVGGLDVILNFREDFLRVGRGYGITPTGEEVFLPEYVEASNLAERIWECCGPPPNDCTKVDDEQDSTGQVLVTYAWLIARPTSTTDEPRPGIPEGCDHPANELLPTRRCQGVRLELICEGDVSAPHQPEALSSATLKSQVCHAQSNYLAMPQPYGDDVSYLVLCRLIRFQVNDDLQVLVDPSPRQPLLPVSVLQQYLQACVCPSLHEHAPEEDDDTPPSDASPPRPGGIVIPKPPTFDWNDLRKRLRIEDLIPRRDPFDPDDGVTDPPRFREDLSVVEDEAMVAKLAAAGINGPVGFIEADAEVIAEATGLTLDKVNRTKKVLGDMRHLFDGPRF